MKKTSLAAMLVLGMLVSVTARAQIPTTDIAAIIEAVVEFGETAAQWETEAQQWQQNYNEIVRLKSLTEQLPTSLNGSTLGEMRSITATGNQVLKQLESGFGANATPADQLKASRNAVDSGNAVISGQQSNLDAEAQRMDGLAAQSQNATGTLQAQQAGNQINLEVAQQIQLLRAQQMAQSQAQNAAFLAEQKAREADQNVNKLFFGGK